MVGVPAGLPIDLGGHMIRWRDHVTTASEDTVVTILTIENKAGR